MAKANKNRIKKVIEKEDKTKQKLPDGTRKYKMFKISDEESEAAVNLSRFLLRRIDVSMLDAMTYEEKDKDGNITGSEIVIYTRDDEKGDIVFTIGATYITKDEVREKNDSLNEGETITTTTKED